MQMNTIPTNVGSSTGTISKKKDKSKKGKKQPLTKNDIGAPTNFQFVVTVLCSYISAVTLFGGRQNNNNNNNNTDDF